MSTTPVPAALTSTAINTTLPLIGGGDLSASRTIALSGPIGGLTSLTNHGVVIGQGAAPVVATVAGTAGQVLTSNGAAADPTFQAAGGGTLAATLAAGNTTGGHNIAVSNGDSITLSDGTQTANILCTAATFEITGPNEGGANVLVSDAANGAALIINGIGVAATVSLAINSGAILTVDHSKNVILNNTGAALLTTAINGFAYVPNCAGTPTGVPATLPTGATPMIYDTTANKIWFYNGSWRGVAVT